MRHPFCAKTPQRSGKGCLRCAHQIFHGLHRVLSGSSLTGQHHAGRAVQHGVVNVTHLGTGGHRAGAHAVQHLGHYHKGHACSPAGGGKLLLAAGQLPQRHGIAKVSAGNHHLIHKVDEFRQGTHTGHVFNFGKDTDIRSPGFFQRMAQGQNICFAAHKRQHHTGNTALLCNFQVLQVFLRQGRRGHRKARCSNAFAALQGAAAHHGAHKGFRQCLCDLHQKLAVVQQKLLSGRSRLYQSCRARYAVCAKAYRAALNQSNVVVLGIYYKLQTFLYLPANGIVQGMRPLIGYNYGAKQHARVKKLYELTLIMSAAIMAAGTVICLFASRPLMQLFTSNPETVAIGQTALRIICLGFVVSAVSTTSSGALEGLGKGAESLVISLCRYIVFIMPLAAVLCHFLGANGVWHAFWITEVLSAIVAYPVYRKAIGKC